MKRLISLLTALLLCAAMPLAHADMLSDEAIEIGATMHRLAASYTYTSLFTNDYADRFAELGRCDAYPTRVSCYALELDLAKSLGTASLSEEEQTVIYDFLFASIFSAFNSQQGVEALVVSSTLSYGKSIAVDPVPSNRFYLLEYASGPDIVVTVTPGKGAVSMAGTFLMAKDCLSQIDKNPTLTLTPIDIE